MREPESDTEALEALRNRPEQDAEKIRSMFNRISGAYDRLNRILTMGIDRSWRRKAVRALGNLRGKRCLDLCCGTCEMVRELSRRSEGTIGEIVAVDFSEKMLELAEPKIRMLPNYSQISLKGADVTDLPLDDSSFDIATVAFGIRNVGDIPAALAEVRRVLTPGGRFMILEFSTPDDAIVRSLYFFYLRHILPWIGGALSGDHRAYRYLNESAEKFPSGEEFVRILSRAGFTSVSRRPLTFGLVTVYLAEQETKTV
ncbi:MAG: bifunctional demethylmenaquinone methyltransferase/2-methoxy-6-polyprenyl-1,4-benzoquinol methylase UbiE [Candidatus Zixiibacteriota bacterium]